MDWTELTKHMPADRQMPARANRLAALTLALAGKQYDHLQHPFSRERHGMDEYVPLDQRRPSVRTNLLRTLVDDSVSLLFSEGHWPSIKADSPVATAFLATLVQQTALNSIMIDAATAGSIGSVAILFRAIDNRPFFDVMPTINLTPEWAPGPPNQLARVLERYKVNAAELIAQGYSVDPQRGKYWFQRAWDVQRETWYEPWPVADDSKAAPVIDASRTVTHGLGFVPIVWVRNLPGGDDVDGACSFEAAIDTVIETDYLLSQAGRALKYGSDPTLVLKTAGTATGGPARTGGAASALELPPEGDARLLEINGSAASAVLDHVRYLRSLALEAMHGNRSDSDRVTAAQSGRAQELMHQGLIWLADRLRISYGEGALLSLLRMVCAASQKLKGGVIIGDTAVKNLDPAGLALHWPAWFQPTPSDGLAIAQGIVTAFAGDVVSQESAVRLYAAAIGLDDPAAELKRVLAEVAKRVPAAPAVRAEADIVV